MLEALPHPTVKYFPYESIRPFQDTFIRATYEAVCSGSNICIEGPNGLGKTIAVLSAALPVADTNDYGILYCTRTHRECDRVIEELKAINHKTKVSGVALRSRRDMCLHPLMSQHIPTPREALDICEQLRKRDLCPFYKNLRTRPRKIKKIQTRYGPKPISASEIIQICKKEKLCPYELAKLLLGRAKVIALSYYYVFDPVIRTGFFKYLFKPPQSHILVLDEAHNIPTVAVEIASDSLTLTSIRKAYMEARKHLHEDVASFCRALGKILMELSESKKEEILIDPMAFIETIQNRVIGGDILHFLNYLCDVGNDIRSALLQRNEFPRSYIGRVGDFLLNWIRTIDNPSFTHILSSYQTEGGGISSRLEAVALDPRIVTEPILSSVYSSVSISGTLEPTKRYAKIIGLPEDTTHHKSVPSPFPRENVLCLACKGVTTSLKHRGPEMYRKLAERCAEVTRYTPANTGIFAASYEVLEGILASDFEDLIEKPLFIEHQDMSSKDNATLIRKFKACARNGGAVLLGVQGGRGSEGVDYPGDEMNSVVVVGVPYAKPSPRVSAQIQFYEKAFPGHGQEFGYVIPAMRRASQAAGRPIRSLTDKGAIIFLDYRFSTRYCRRYLPLWIRRNLKTIQDEDGALAKELILFFGFNTRT